MQENNHRPTNEELDQNIDRITKELETMSPDDEVGEIDSQESEESEQKTETAQETDDTELTKEEKKPVKETTDDSEPDYKEKYTESTREAQILYSKNRKMMETIEEAAKILEIDEKELRVEYPDWEDMTEREQKFATEFILSNKRWEAITKTSEEFKQREEWEQKVRDFSDDPTILNKYPELEGRADEFRTFATKKSRVGADLDDVATSFLWNYQKSRPNHKGQLFETGTGGEKEEKKDDKISAEEGAKLRQTDYKKWKSYVAAGKIKTDL